MIFDTVQHFLFVRILFSRKFQRAWRRENEVFDNISNEL